MKFVFNEEKNEEMRHILMIRPTVEEGEKLLAKGRYRRLRLVAVYGTALGLQGGL